MAARVGWQCRAAPGGGQRLGVMGARVLRASNALWRVDASNDGCRCTRRARHALESYLLGAPFRAAATAASGAWLSSS